MPILENINEYLFENIQDPCAFMHHNNQPYEEQMHYIVNRFMKADMPVAQ